MTPRARLSVSGARSCASRFASTSRGAARTRKDVTYGFERRAWTMAGTPSATTGATGLRPHYHAGYYAAFVIDPDRNNVEAVLDRQLPVA